MTKALTPIEFEKTLIDKYGEAFKFDCSDYKNMQSKINCVCTNCDFKTSKPASGLKFGNLICNVCSKNSGGKMTKDEYTNKVKYIGMNKWCTITGDFKGTTKPVSIKCKECNHVRDVTANRLYTEEFTCRECYKEHYQISHNDFCNKIKDIYGEDFTVVSSYTKSIDLISLKCNKCGYIDTRAGNSFTSGKKAVCKECAKQLRKPNRIKVEEYQDRLNEKYGNLFKFDLSQYDNDIVGVTCNRCEYSKAIDRWGLIINNCNYKCRICSEENISAPLSEEEFLVRVSNFQENDRFNIGGEYKNSQSLMNITCNDCGTKRDVVTRFLYSKKVRCHCCDGENYKFQIINSNVMLRTSISEIHGDRYELIPQPDFKGGMSTKFDVLCSDCNTVRTTDIKQLLILKTQCKECLGINPYTDETVKDAMYEIVEGDYTIMSKYVNAHTQLKIRHNSDSCNGHEFHTTFHNFRNGSRCPICEKVRSRGEQAIMNYLVDSNINFRREYSFDDLKHTKSLRYDFAIKVKDVLALIEFDGIQHFEPREFFGGVAQLEIQRKIDEKKSDYCTSKGIPILRIPYWDLDNVNIILDRYIENIMQGMVFSEE